MGERVPEAWMVQWHRNRRVEFPLRRSRRDKLSAYPKSVWARRLVLTRQHVNDVQAFRTWISELLEEHRNASSEHTCQ